MKDKKQSLGTLVITKELFIETIEALSKQNLHDRRCSIAFQAILPDDFITGYNNSYLTHQLINLLKLSFKDNNKDSWIDYFIYELDFGVKYTDGCVTDKDGQNIPFATAEDLYNFLVLTKE